MAAESNPVRRLRRLIAPVLAAAAVVWCSAAAGAAIAGVLTGGADASVARTAAATATDDAEAGIRISVAPVDATVITTTAPQEFAVEVANDTADPLPAGTVRLLVADDPLEGAAGIDAWSTLGAGDSDDAPPSTEVGRTEVRGILPGSAATVRIPVPAGAFDADASLVGVAAQLDVDDTLLATGTAAFASASAPASAPVGLALAAPLTVPAQSTGLLTADRLEAWTAPAGLLTRQLDALGDRSVAIGVDPRIIASIRALGTSAPASAVAWLERLAALPNEVFPLAYGDADLAVQAQLGLDAPLEPISFDDALNPDDFAAPATDGGDAGTAATATPMPTTMPDTGALLDWSYTRTDLAWPADATVANDNLGWFAAAGLTTTILDPANVASSDALVGAASTIGGSTAVVADGRVTSALRQAAAAASDTEWRSSTGRLLAELAAAAGDGGAARVTLLATFERSAGDKAERVQATVDAINGVPWSTPATLTDAIGAPPTPRTLIDLPEDDQRRSNVDRMLQAERSVDEFSAVLDEPTVLTAPTRRELLSLLDVAWIPQVEEWTSAVGTWLIEQRAVTDGVSVVPSSSVLVVATETGIPVTVQNSLPYQVDVVVHVQPTNGRLIVEEPVDVTVEPESRSTVVVPVAAGVGNGEVSLEVSLTAQDGTPVGDPVLIPANVHADWEGLGAAILATIAVVVFGVGLWRNIVRRRRRRSEAPEGTDAPAEADGAETHETDAADADAAASGTDDSTAPAPASTEAPAPAPAERPAPAAAPSPDRHREDPRDG